MFYLSQSELLLHLFLTAALFGASWVLQLVHYPSYRFIEEKEWESFYKSAVTNSAWLLTPLMILELSIAAWLAGKNGFSLDYGVPLAILLLIWLCTFLLHLPTLQKLAEGKDLALIKILIRYHWIRTVLWSAKLLWVSWLAYSIWG